MNKIYIKRQLKLHSLGLEINEDIKSMIEYFYKTIDVSSMKSKYVSNTGYVYYENDKPLFLYDDNRYLLINIYLRDIFEDKFDITHKELSNFITSIFESTFNIKVILSLFIDKDYIYLLENE